MPQIHVLEQLRGPLARLPPAQAGAEGAELDVLENGEAGKRGDVLEGADDAAGHEPLRLLEGQVDAVDGPDAFEVDADPLRDELPGARAVDSVLHRFLLVP